MRVLRVSLAWSAIAVQVVSCADAFTCIDDPSCGDGGRCEPTGFCSFADDDCPSGRRYGEHASAALAGKCVEEPVAEGTGTTTDVGTTLTTTMGAMSAEGPSAEVTTTDPTTGAVTTTASTTDPTLTGDVSTDVDSSGGGERIELGPLVVENDFDDGAMWPETGSRGAWFPSGEAEPGWSFMGEHPDGHAYFGYFRFRLPIALPTGTIVTAAHFEVGGYGTYQWSDVSHALRIWVEQSNDAAQVTSLGAYPDGGNVSSAQLGDASVRWPELGGLAWNGAGTNASPQLVVPLQALIDSSDAGLAEGAHVQLWIGCDELGNGTREVGWIDRSGADDGVGTLWLEVELP